MSILEKIKTALRISHSKLDQDIQSDIEACIADLKVCGIVHAGEEDPLILNAIKLWCRSLYTDDTTKAEVYRVRYEAFKSCLMIAEGYGWRDNDD